LNGENRTGIVQDLNGTEKKNSSLPSVEQSRERENFSLALACIKLLIKQSSFSNSHRQLQVLAVFSHMKTQLNEACHMS
jgi:hypothetical protein